MKEKFFVIIRWLIIGLLCISICSIPSFKFEGNNEVVDTIDAGEFVQLSSIGYEISEENGHIKYIQQDGDPQVNLTTPQQNISGIIVRLFEPVETEFTVQLYFAANNEGFSEEKSVFGYFIDSSTILINIPHNTYTGLRLDINGNFVPESVEFLKTTKSTLINYKALICFAVLIVLAIILEKKIGLFKGIKKYIVSEIDFISEKAKQRKYTLVILRIVNLFVSAATIVAYFIFINWIWINKITLLVLALTFGTLIVKIIDRLINKSNIEPAKMFLLISLVIGISLAVTLPLGARSWDEQIHYGNTVNVVNCIYNYEETLADVNTISLKYGFVASDAAVSNILIHDEIGVEYDAGKINIYNDFAYLPSAIIMVVCSVLGTNFVTMNLLAKCANVLVYSIVIYMGIKRLKSGGYLFAAIGLLPTSLFIAASFSYDYWVTAFIAYSYAYLISILQDKDKKIEFKDSIIMALTMFIACGPKAIYIVLMFPFFFLPRSKFDSPKTQKKHIIICAVLVLLAVISFVIPFLTDVEGRSDMRGGPDVNATEQIKYILKNPFRYAVTLIKYMSQYTSFGTCVDWLSFYAYVGNSPYWCSSLVFIAILFSAFCDKNDSDMFNGVKVFKGTSLVAAFGALVLICTTLYIAFTAVGSGTIAGVQFRYLFPVFFPFFYCIGSAKIKNNMSQTFMSMCVFGALTLGLIGTTVDIYLPLLK